MMNKEGQHKIGLGSPFKIPPNLWREESIPLTLIYRVNGIEKEMKQSLNVRYWRLAIVGDPALSGGNANDYARQESLLFLPLLEGKKYRITVEVMDRE